MYVPHFAFNTEDYFARRKKKDVAIIVVLYICTSFAFQPYRYSGCNEKSNACARDAGRHATRGEELCIVVSCVEPSERAQHNTISCAAVTLKYSYFGGITAAMFRQTAWGGL